MSSTHTASIASNSQPQRRLTAERTSAVRSLIEVVAPVHDGSQRLLAGQRGAGTAGEHRESVVKSLSEHAKR